MISLSFAVSQKVRYLQFWTKERQYFVVDVGSKEYVNYSARSEIESVQFVISVDGVTRGVVLGGYPDVNDDDDGLDLHSLACSIRFWDAEFRILDQVGLTWSKILELPTKTKFGEIVCDGWKGVGKVCSSSSIPRSYKWLEKRSKDVCPPAVLFPDRNVSGEMAFVYFPGERLATDAWFRNLIERSTDILFGSPFSSSKELSHADEMVHLLSFMFFGKAVGLGGDIKFVDLVLQAPTTKTDCVCRAYHLAMNMIFEKSVVDPIVTAFRKKVVELVGFPYVVWTGKAFELVFIPYELLNSLFEVNLPTTMMFCGGELRGFGANLEVYHAQEFSADPRSADVDRMLSEKDPIKPKTDDASFLRTNYVLGNAHSILCPDASPCFVHWSKTPQKEEEWVERSFVAVARVADDKEMGFVVANRGVPIPLDFDAKTKSKPLNEELSYYSAKKNLRVKYICPAPKNLNKVEKELEVRGYDVDVMFAPGSEGWILRVGTLKNGYWF